MAELEAELEEASKEASAHASSAARLPLIVGVVLILGKGSAFFFTGSTAIAASLVDSILDMLSSSLNWFALKKSEEPPDETHGWGHGKAESLSGLFQAGIILSTATLLVSQAIYRIMSPVTINALPLGVLAMTISTVISASIATYLHRQGTLLDSIALKADALHYKSDVYTGLTTLAALGLLRITGWNWLDPIASIIIAVVIAYSAWDIAKQSLQQLMDHELSQEKRDAIATLVTKQSPAIFGIHQLRTRRAGNIIVMDMHVELDAALSFIDAHTLIEKIEDEICKTYPDAIVNIHPDPYLSAGVAYEE